MNKNLFKKLLLVMLFFTASIIFLLFFIPNSPDLSKRVAIYDKKITRPFLNLEKSNGIFTNIWFRDEKSLDLFVKNNMRYLFVDVGHIEKNGKLMTSEEELKSFINFINDYENRNNFYFVLLPYNEIILDNYNFSSLVFRKNIIKNHLDLIKLGFDGAFIDIEAIPSSKRSKYLNFLEEIGKEIRKDKFLGVYAGALDKSPNKWEWEQEFYNAVSDKVDIILIPGYDFHFNNKQDYQEYLDNQIKEISSFDLNSELFFTAPTHKPYPETIENSLEIYNKETTLSDNQFIGIVIFAEWTTDNSEWKVFENYQNFSF